MPVDPTPAWFTEALAAPVGTGEVEVDGVTIRYRAWGEPAGPVREEPGTSAGAASGLVLVHGGGAHSRWWDHVAPLLVQRGQGRGRRRVVALDLSGHGDSGRATDYRLSRWSDEVLAVARHAGAGDRPVVIGHSMGGFVALTAALRHGHDLTGVMAVDSPVRERSPEELAARQQRAFGPMRVYPDRATALSHFRTVPEQDGDLPYVLSHVAGHSVREVPGGWSWKFDRGIFSGLGLTPGELGRVPCRVALFRAEYGLVGADMGEMIVDLMGRAAPLVEIPGAAHHVMIDQPLALVTGLRTMLADWEHSVPRVPAPFVGHTGVGHTGSVPARFGSAP